MINGSGFDNLDGFDGVKKGLRDGSIKRPVGTTSDDVSFEIDQKKLNSVPSKDEISLE